MFLNIKINNQPLTKSEICYKILLRKYIIRVGGIVMNKYLFMFNNQNILVNAKNKMEAITIVNEKFTNILENDFQIITISIELNSNGEIVAQED